MDDALLNYYEQELSYIRQMGAEFAGKYPKIAGRLLLEHDKSSDPHTERLIEAFAFISGRIHKKIDDDFPEITQSLFNVIYPHYNNPIPSLTIARFEPMMQNISEAGYRIDRGTKLYSKPVYGNPCQFTTCHPVEIWPVEITAAGLRDPRVLVKDSQQAIYIQLKTANNLPISKLAWKSLRFYLHGQHQQVFHLYELLFNNVCQVECESAGNMGNPYRILLAPSPIGQVGFEEDESALSFPSGLFPAIGCCSSISVFLKNFSFSTFRDLAN